MPDILQTTFSDAFSLEKGFICWWKCLLYFVPEDPINSKSALFRAMAECQTGGKSLLVSIINSVTPYGITRPQLVNQLIVDW